ncbi:MAG: hypothetical protein FWG40_04175 [Peptococcaceae bacterium]|nr:hypothetical protein [Peptococcaceae bacterium]
MKGLGVSAILLVSIVLVISIILFAATDIIMPTHRFLTAAVELESGEILKVNGIGLLGAVTKNGEYLIEYDSRAENALGIFVALYTDSYYGQGNRHHRDPSDPSDLSDILDLLGLSDVSDLSDISELSDISDLLDFWDLEPVKTDRGWKISDSSNPWFDGEISNYYSTGKYCSSERVYHSPTEYHEVITLYDQNGTAKWSHDDREKLSGSYSQRVKLGYSKHGSGSNILDFAYPKCINVNRLLAEVYGINVELVYDKKNKLVTFKVPRKVMIPYEE